MTRPKHKHWCWRKHPREAAQRLLWAYKDFTQERKREPTRGEWKLLEQRVEASFEGVDWQEMDELGRAVNEARGKLQR